jgi:hypothetical protein
LYVDSPSERNVNRFLIFRFYARLDIVATLPCIVDMFMRMPSGVSVLSDSVKRCWHVIVGELTRGLEHVGWAGTENRVRMVP